MDKIEYEEYKYNVREWLNKSKASTASIAPYIDIDYAYIDAGVEIRDCTRSINLDFGVDKHHSLEDKIEKIDLIIKVFEDFRAHMLAAYPVYLENQKRFDELKEKKADNAVVA